ncbi:MAG: hypothetical protein WAS56_00010 [Saprospiraceae bacterium]|nr:hypothetical protein [Saprospiraceae bacterium]
MKNIINILLILFPVIIYSQTKGENFSQRRNPYPLKTPDYLCFKNKFDTVTLYNDFISVGYANALKDKRKVKLFPIATSQIRTNEVYNSLYVYILFGDGETMGSLAFMRPSFEKGIYELKNINFMENGYYSIITQHGCSGREVYRITVKEFSKSFLKIISYNEETGELKARFRVHYQMDEAEKITYPDSPSKVLFEDGVIHTYVEKIYE